MFADCVSRRFFSILVLSTSLSAVAADLTKVQYNVRFRDAPESLIVLPVTINNSGPFDFLLDTGTGETAIDGELAAELDLPHVGNVSLMTLPGSAVLSIVRAGSLAMGGATVLGFNMNVVNHLTGLPVKVRGILGEDYLRNFDLLIDNRRHLIAFESGPGALADTLKGEHLAFSANGLYRGELTPNRLVVIGHAFELANKDLRFQLDSGANVVVVFAELGSSATRERQQTSLMGTRGAETGLRTAAQRVCTLHLGTRAMVNVTIVAPSPVPETDVEALLPTSLFHSIFISHSGKFAILDPKRTKGAS